jgi:hypothetical protein
MAPRPLFPRRLSLSVLGLLGVLGGCIQSHDVEPTDDGGNGGGRAGTGGRGGNGGSGGRAGAGGSPNMGNESCETGCSGTSMFGVTVPGCCTDNDKCGLDIAGLGFGEGCAELNAPGTANDACPSQSLGGFLTLAGCCKPDGTCGVLDSFVGLGCTSTGAAEGTSCEP